jgi:SM-20-related protein
LEEIIQSLSREGWIHIPGFLNASELKSINEFFDGHKSEFIPAQIGKGDARKINTEIRGDHTFWLDPLAPQNTFKQLINFIDDLKQEVNRSLFLGLKEFECHLAYYPPGTFYKKHLDRFEQDSSRALTFIFYVHENWSPGSGGELVLYDKDQRLLKMIEPLPGSLLCFLSGDFPHEVKMSHFERRTFTGWIHNKIIN